MGEPDPRTDGELLIATADEPEAFAIFYRRHVRGVLGFFRRRVLSAEVALDLTAETFAAALEASPRYMPRPEPARGWLYGIAWTKLHEAGRRGRSEDIARCNLGMAPIALGGDGIAQIEAVAGASALLQRPHVDQRRSSVAPAVSGPSAHDLAAVECSASIVSSPVRRRRTIRTSREAVRGA